MHCVNENGYANKEEFVSKCQVENVTGEYKNDI